MFPSPTSDREYYDGRRNGLSSTSRDFPPKTSTSIKKISPTHSDISAEILATIIRIPAGLEELTISWGGLWNIEGSVPWANLELLGKSLVQHKHTLRVLDLDVGFASTYLSQNSSDDESDEDEYNVLSDPDISDEDCRLDEAISEGPLRPEEIKDGQAYDGKIGSLHHYTSLTQVSISIRALFGDLELNSPVLAKPPSIRLIDMLPSNLEYLRLYG